MNINSILKGGLIALFFSTQIMAFDKPDTVSPDMSVDSIAQCGIQYNRNLGTVSVSGTDVEHSALIEACKPLIASGLIEYFSNAYKDCTYTATVSWLTDQFGNPKPEITYKIKNWKNQCQEVTYAQTTYVFLVQESNTATCPPAAHPDYFYPIMDENGEQVIACDDDNPAFEQCPQGNYKYAVKGQCVPIDCPPTGTADTIWGSGSTYSNNAGTYCNGQCAFTTGGGQNDNGSKGNIPLQVVSNGAVCGDGTGNWHADGNGDDNCTKSNLDTGAIFVTCSNGNTDTGEETDKPVDLGEQKDEEPLELIPVLESCGPDDVTCEVRNLQEKVENENKELKAEQQEQHNKKIEADEKATIKLINAIQELKEFNTIGQQQITAAIKADTGTGSSGGGTGTVTLDGDGAGLEDSEIGEAFGGLDDEISEDTVTLSSYSAPYSGWISTSACPSTQSISLTINGISTTLDADHTPMCSFFAFLGKILLAASYVGVAFMIQRSI